MKTRFLLLIIAFVFLSLSLKAQTKSPKRGFGGDVTDLVDAASVSQVAWYYNWGQSALPAVVNKVKKYVDYTPMAWGANYDRTALKTYLSTHPEIKYLLGFNEPNFLAQSNLGPKAAAALWPELQAIADEFHLKLVSPAMNFCYTGGAVIENGIEYVDPVKYLDDFFAACPNCRVDYIAIHGYFDNAAALPWYIGLFSKYNKPLWLTEFNQSASWVNDITQQQYMVEALNYLEKEPAVFRYAWFLSRSSQLNTNLFTVGTTGVLTDLGYQFVNMSSNDTNYYHKVADTIQAEHYVDMSGIHLIRVQDVSGKLAVHDFDSGDWMDYNVNVALTGNYPVSFRITSINTTTLSVYSETTLLGTLEVPNTGGFENWQTFSMNLNLLSGKQKLRIVASGGGWKLNWWRISSPSCSGSSWANTTTYAIGSIVSYNGHQWQAKIGNKNKIPQSGNYWLDLGLCGIKSAFEQEELLNTNDSEIKIFPNPVNVSGTLTVKTTIEIYSIEIIDINGKIILHKENLNKTSTIDVAKLKSGVYYLKIISNEGNSVNSFVVN